MDLSHSQFKLRTILYEWFLDVYVDLSNETLHGLRCGVFKFDYFKEDASISCTFYKPDGRESHTKFIKKSIINDLESTTQAAVLRQARAMYGMAKGYISDDEWY